MTAATIIRFPPQRRVAVLVCPERDGGGWLALAANGHGWPCGSLDEARREAKWLARNLGLPIWEAAI
jgi:hypothetical protein